MAVPDPHNGHQIILRGHLPTQRFAVGGQRLDCQGGTGGEQHLYDHIDDDGDDGIDDADDDDDDNDGTWVESGAQASA